MTVQAMPWAIQGQTHPGENARNLTAAIFGAPVAALVEGISITTAGGAHGIVGATDLAVTQNGGGNMSVNVAAGRAIIRSTEAASLLAGAYSFLNDGTLNVVVAAADPTNPRIDLVIAQVRDSNYSGANTDARLTVVTGTPAGSPVTPAVPDSCVVLAQVAVAAGVTSILTANITDKRTRAYAIGGMAICTSTTRPSGVSLYEGLVILELDSDRILVYDGTNWIRLGWYSAAGRTGGSWSRAAVQSIGISTLTTINWDTKITDSDSFNATPVATTTIPAGLAGLYAITISGLWATAPTGNNFLRIVAAGNTYDMSGNTVGQIIGGGITIPMAAADTIVCQAWQTSGAAINLTAKLFLNRIGA